MLSSSVSLRLWQRRLHVIDRDVRGKTSDRDRVRPQRHLWTVHSTTSSHRTGSLQCSESLTTPHGSLDCSHQRSASIWYTAALVQRRDHQFRAFRPCYLFHKCSIASGPLTARFLSSSQKRSRCEGDLETWYTEYSTEDATAASLTQDPHHHSGFCAFILQSRARPPPFSPPTCLRYGLAVTESASWPNRR